MAKTALKRFNHKTGKNRRLGRFIQFDLTRHFKFAILYRHCRSPLVYTRLRLRALHQLWGTGVVSRITLITRPALCNPRTADSRPAPGPLRLTSHSFILTKETASLAAFCAATVAAKAEDLREPEKFAFPAEDQEITFPAKSVIETIVLLKVAFTWAIPD